MTLALTAGLVDASSLSSGTCAVPEAGHLWRAAASRCPFVLVDQAARSQSVALANGGRGQGGCVAGLDEYHRHGRVSSGSGFLLT